MILLSMDTKFHFNIYLLMMTLIVFKSEKYEENKMTHKYL